MPVFGDDNDLTPRWGRRRNIPGNPLAPQTSTLPMGNPFEPGPTTDAPPADSPAPAPAPRPNAGTSVLGADSGKLSDPSHALKSPKYSFFQKAPLYGRGQEGQLLADLQGDANVGRFWQGWQWDGRGNFVYGGNPSALAPEWNGVTRVDAYKGYNAGGPLQAQWGISQPGMNQPGTNNGLQQLIDALSGPTANLWQTPPRLDPTPPGWTMPPNPNGPYVPYQTPGYQAPADVSSATPPPTVTGAPTPLNMQPGAVNQSLRMLALQLPRIIQQRGIQDPLVQQILRQLGGQV